MPFKPHLLATALLLAGASLPVLAFQIGDSAFSLDTTLTAASDYRSRGISQTRNDPALQATSVLSHGSGAYAAFFISNYDFGTAAKREQDYVLGWALPLGEQLTLDLGWAKYEYVKDASLNYSETYASLSGWGVTLGVNYADDVADKESYLYTYLGYEHPLPADTTLSLRLGHADFKDDFFFKANGKGRSRYSDWQIGVSRDWLGLTWQASYVDTDVSRAECHSYGGSKRLCDAALLLEVSKTF